MPRPEFAPDAALIEAVRDQVVAEIIERLTRELRHPIVLGVSAHRETEQIAAVGTLASRSGTGAVQRGEARLRFRPTGDPDRVLFLADGRLERDERNPTYSGFIVEGAVTRDPSTGAGSARFTTWVVKHNDPDWAYW
jgi:hypothetical protein